MRKVLLFCFFILLFVVGNAVAAPDNINNSNKAAFTINKHTESGRGAFTLNNQFHNYCVDKYHNSSEMYRCKNMCIEKGYPVFNETGSVEAAIKASGCFKPED